MRISDWSSDVCSSDLDGENGAEVTQNPVVEGRLGGEEARPLPQARHQRGREHRERDEEDRAVDRTRLGRCHRAASMTAAWSNVKCGDEGNASRGEAFSAADSYVGEGGEIGRAHV